MNLHSNQGSNQQKSLIQGLLSEIYHRYRADQQLDSSTEASCLSDATHGRHLTYSKTLEELERQQTRKLQKSFLQSKSIAELSEITQELDERVAVVSARLVRQLRQRSRLRDKNQRFCDMLTAILQAVSQKRRVDTKLNFSLEPSPGAQSYKQWRDTLRAILRLPRGMPEQWRKKVWSYLADNYIKNLPGVDWNQMARHVFSERFNPDDDRLDNQIVKDLHRTGYTKISEGNCEEGRMVLKRVLLAYARWNKIVGYCQGFNVIAALILEVTQNDEQLALKIMVYLVDGVLPESYFAENLRGLSNDMAVFRDLLRARLPELSKHFDTLQRQANDQSQGHNYEPPLTNVFTMQWFLTLFATCLPRNVVLRIWDSVLLDGSEILLRVALAIWAKLGEKVGFVQSADEFYGSMAELTKQTLDGKLICADELMKTIYKIASFPFPKLKELREKYKYNITPFVADSDTNSNSNWKKEKRKDYKFSHDSATASESETDTQLERINNNENDYNEDDSLMFTCFGGPTPPGKPSKKATKPAKKNTDLVSASPGAFNVDPNGMLSERMSTDIAALKRQYMKIRNKQLQSHYLIYAKPEKENQKQTSRQIIPLLPESQTASPYAINHLLIGRPTLTSSKSSSSRINSTSLPWKEAILIQKLKSPGRIKTPPIKPLKKDQNPNLNKANSKQQQENGKVEAEK